MFWGFGAKIKPAFCDVWSVWGTKHRAVRLGVGRIGLFISRWRSGNIWNSTMVAEPEGALINQGVVG